MKSPFRPQLEPPPSASKPKTSNSITALPWITGGALAALLGLVLFGYSAYEKSIDLDRTRAALIEARAAVQKNVAERDRILAESTDLKSRLSANQSRIDELEKEKDAVVERHKSLEDEMRAALESKDVTISELQGKLTVNILDRVLFDSGEAELKPDGEEVLRKVAAILTQHPKLAIHVIGHTDNVPIRAGLRNRFASNWELSTARAIAAVRFLSEKAGVDPRRLGAVGYGEFRPVAENSTPEGRARNRRIAITILSEELAGADTAPTAKNRPPGISPAGAALAATNAAPEVPDDTPLPPTHPPED